MPRFLPFAAAVLLALTLTQPSPVQAHAPLLDCFAEGKDIVCEGGFSDGSSATGISIRVLDAHDKVLLEGKIDGKGRFSFARPAGDFHIVFDAGAGHQITLFGSDIQ